MSTIEEQIQGYIREQIPLSKGLGFHVVSITKDQVVVSAPFQGNSNHKNSVFGGSLHCLTTLACWTLLYITLKEHGYSGDIVITKSTIQYIKPVIEDFSAECLKPDATTCQTFLDRLHSRGKSKIDLSAKIYQGGLLAVDFLGTFAAITPRKP